MALPRLFARGAPMPLARDFSSRFVPWIVDPAT